MKSLFSSTRNTELIRDLHQQVLDKAKVILSIKGKGNIEIPIGTEWSDENFQKGIHMIEVKGYRDNDDSMLIIVDAPAGAEIEAHYHDNTETIMCVKGVVKCPINNRYLRKGKTWEIKPGVLHAMVFEEDTQLAIMWHPKFQ